MSARRVDNATEISQSFLYLLKDYFCEPLLLKCISEEPFCVTCKLPPRNLGQKCTVATPHMAKILIIPQSPSIGKS